MNPIRAVTGVLLVTLMLASLAFAIPPAKQLGKTFAPASVQVAQPAIAVALPATFQPITFGVASLTTSTNHFQPGTAKLAIPTAGTLENYRLPERDFATKPEPGIVIRA